MFLIALTGNDIPKPIPPNRRTEHGVRRHHHGRRSVLRAQGTLKPEPAQGQSNETPAALHLRAGQGVWPQPPSPECVTPQKYAPEKRTMNKLMQQARSLISSTLWQHRPLRIRPPSPPSRKASAWASTASEAKDQLARPPPAPDSPKGVGRLPRRRTRQHHHRRRRRRPGLHDRLYPVHPARPGPYRQQAPVHGLHSRQLRRTPKLIPNPAPATAGVHHLDAFIGVDDTRRRGSIPRQSVARPGFDSFPAGAGIPPPDHQRRSHNRVQPSPANAGVLHPTSPTY